MKKYKDFFFFVDPLPSATHQDLRLYWERGGGEHFSVLLIGLSELAGVPMYFPEIKS